MSKIKPYLYNIAQLVIIVAIIDGIEWTAALAVGATATYGLLHAFSYTICTLALLVSKIASEEEKQKLIKAVVGRFSNKYWLNCLLDFAIITAASLNGWVFTTVIWTAILGFGEIIRRWAYRFHPEGHSVRGF